MGPKCAVTALAFVLLTTVASPATSKSSGPDASAAAKSPNIRNAPFSADVITEYDRTLDNGGHIHRESRGKIWRDSLGRMRTENQSAVQFASEKSDRITINDPVQQVIIYLYPRNKVATVCHFGDANSQPPAVLAKSSKPKDKATVRAGGQPGIGNGPADTLGVPPVPTGQGNTANTSIPSAGEGQSKSGSGTFTNSAGATTVPLGSKTIEGSSATGTRTTRTINPGRMGNDRPIVSISDTWVSSDLKITVLTETDDGQAGHSTTKLVNIVRSEPNPALFQIPADYAVKESPSTLSARH